MKTKPFDLEAAKSGAKVVTKEGDPVRIICFDRKDKEGYSLIGLVACDDGIERVFSWTARGIFRGKVVTNNKDLAMPTETVERYAIVGKDPATGDYYTNGYLYESENCAQEALREEREALEASFCTVVGIAKVEIEV